MALDSSKENLVPKSVIVITDLGCPTYTIQAILLKKFKRDSEYGVHLSTSFKNL